MAKKSKKFRRNKEKCPQEAVPLAQAVEVLKKLDGAKFDESVEVAVRLGIDTENTAQSVRGAFSLPHGIGKETKVIAFADGAVAEEARQAGAIAVGAEDLAKRIQDGWIDFDVAIAHPSMMKHVGRLGRVLGPHGKMPTPKSGTVTENVPQAVREFRAGKVEFRNDTGGNVHAIMGKKSFAVNKLVENITAFIEHLKSMRPPTAKGVYIQRVTISTTMGPGIAIVVS